MTVRILVGDVRDQLRELPDESVHCVISSPPYWGLRDYGIPGQLGLEPTIGEHVAVMVEVFHEVRRVLRRDGTLWLNYGDSYASTPSGNKELKENPCERFSAGAQKEHYGGGLVYGGNKADTEKMSGLKAKNLIGMPWRIALALQQDGWWLRQDIIWSKPNPMPESITDRCTKAHEYIFLLTKSPRYYYDADAIRDPISENWSSDNAPTVKEWGGRLKADRPQRRLAYDQPKGRNKRSVWEIPTEPFPGAHFATFPTKLVEPCIKAGCPRGGTVLDPFGGAGTTGLVADRLQRNAILIELNPKYAAMAKRRIHDDAPMFSHMAAE